MTVDTSFYQAATGPQRSLADYQQQYQGIAQNALNLQRSKQQLDAYTQDQAEKASLRNYLASSPDLSTAQGYNGLMAAAPTLGPGIHKTYQDSLTAAAVANKDNAQAGNFKADAGLTNQKATDAAFAHYQNVLGTLQTPEQAVNFTVAAYHDPIIGPILQAQNGGSLEDAVARLQQATATPEGFQQWQAKASLGLGKLAELTKVQNVNTGGKTVTQSVNPATGQVQTMGSLTNTVSPDTADTTATTRRGQDMTQQTAFKVAGLDGNGNFSAGAPGGAAPAGAPAQAGAKNPLDGLVDGIGTYGVKAETAMARMPPAQKAYVMTQLAAKYPDYDPMNYTERQAGIQSFAPNGNNGKTIQALNVSVDHLAKFRDLATALDNGDNQTLNTVGNAIAKWTGSAAPTNFEAAKNIVMDEVTKGVIGAAGGQGDREKMASVVASANSPKQLAGAIDTVTSLMGGRLEGVQKSYESSTRKKDFSTKYLTPQAKAALERANGGGEASPAAAVPAALSGFKITHVDGKPQ